MCYTTLAKGHVESIKISEAQLSSFKIVCANVAKLEVEEGSNISEGAEISDRRHDMEEDDDEVTDEEEEEEEGLQCEKEGENNSECVVSRVITITDILRGLPRNKKMITV